MTKQEQFRVLINVYGALTRLPILGQAAKDFSDILAAVDAVATAMKAEAEAEAGPLMSLATSEPEAAVAQ